MLANQLFSEKQFDVRINSLSGSALPRVTQGNFGTKLSDLSFSVSADGGYDSASFSLNVSQLEAEEWLYAGLMCSVVITSPNGNVVWEGFVNTVEINFGGLAYSVGPMTDIGNRVSAIYTPILDATQDPPLTGSSTTTVIVEDTASQTNYLIWEKVLSYGQLLDDTAEALRDTWLKENAYPKTKTSYTKFGRNTPSIKLNCLGWYTLLKYYVYNQTASSSSVTLATKLQSILGADPNSIFSADYSNIDANALLTTSYEDRNKDAWTLISEITSYGDVNDNRYTFGIYQDKVAYYNAIPTDYEYEEDIRRASRYVSDRTLGRVEPWDILPGKFIRYHGFLNAYPSPSSIEQDPRIMFIEKVDFTAPYDVKLSGSPVSTLDQKVAKLGIQ